MRTIAASSLLALAAGLIIPAAARAATAPAPARAEPTPGPHAHLREGFIRGFTGKPAPAFALNDLHGRTVRLSAYRGQVVLLNFWYSTCYPCRKETPDLIALHNVYKDKGLAILGINLDGILIPESGTAQLQIFLKDFPIPYPILVADKKVFEAYGGLPVQPISFLVDRSGAIARVFWGAYPAAVYDRSIRPLLAAPSGGPASSPATPAGP